MSRRQSISSSAPSFQNHQPIAEAEQALVDIRRVQRALGLPVHGAFTQTADDILLFIDVENYEHDQNLLTEWGQYVVDPRNLRDLTYGKDGAPVLDRGQASHIRVKEHAQLVNKDFCEGYPENFQFGKTAWMSLAQLHQHLSDFFEAALCDTRGPRTVLVIAHDKRAEVRKLSAVLGDKHSRYQSIIRWMDTQELSYYIWSGKRQPRLGEALTEFKLDAQYLHNAGNDAVYTATITLIMAMKRHQESDHRQRNPKDGSAYQYHEHKPEMWHDCACTASGPTSKSAGISMMNVAIQAFKITSRQNISKPRHGTWLYCTCCGVSEDHLFVQCLRRYDRCERCYAVGHLRCACSYPQHRLKILRETHEKKWGKFDTKMQSSPSHC